MPIIGGGGGGSNVAGAEIGYTQITSAVNITDTSEATATALITAGPFTFDGAPVIASFYGLLFLDTNTTSDVTVVSLFEGSTQISRLGTWRAAFNTTNNVVTMFSQLRFTPTAGSHTYKVTAFVSSTGGTPNLTGGLGGTSGNAPAFLRFTKV